MNNNPPAVVTPAEVNGVRCLCFHRTLPSVLSAVRAPLFPCSFGCGKYVLGARIPTPPPPGTFSTDVCVMVLHASSIGTYSACVSGDHEIDGQLRTPSVPGQCVIGTSSFGSISGR